MENDKLHPETTPDNTEAPSGQEEHNQNRGYNPNQGYRPPMNQDNGFATASLIVGIVSLLFACCTGIGGIMLGALGIVFAILSRKNEPMATNAKVGLGISIGGILLGIIVLAATLMFVSSGEFQRELNRYGIEYHQGMPDSDPDYDQDFDYDFESNGKDNVL